MYISLFYINLKLLFYYSFLFKIFVYLKWLLLCGLPHRCIVTVSSQSIDSKWWTSSWWLRCFRGCSRSKCLQHQRYEEALEDCSRQVILTTVYVFKIFGEYLCLYVVLCQNFLLCVLCRPRPYLYKSDHQYPVVNGTDLPVAVLYAEIGTKDFNAFHRFCQSGPQEGKLVYVLRHFVVCEYY